MTESTDYQPVVTGDLSATIAVSTALSGSVDLSGTTIAGFILPSTWTAADVTFQGSIDGTNFFDIYDKFGNEVQIAVAASRMMSLDVTDFACVRYLKIRSGTTGTPVNQAAERIITVLSRGV